MADEPRSALPFPIVGSPSADSFTAHNIRLDDGTLTCPALGRTMDENNLLHAVRRTLSLVFPSGLQGRSIVDIGCLEGGFTTEFARLGMRATGIEVRDSNYRNCLRVKAGTNLPNLTFIKDDAMNIGKHGPFDAAFVSGLLYHLDRPRQFITDLAQICRRVVFLDTHVAYEEVTEGAKIYQLSDIEEHEGLRGRWFSEHDVVTEQELELLKWTSWSNTKSFWIQKELLLQLMNDVGFDVVFEQFDVARNIAKAYTHGFRKTYDRVLLVGVRTA